MSVPVGELGPVDPETGGSPRVEELVAGCAGCVSLTARVEELERKVDALDPDPIALGLMVHRNRMKKEKEGRP